MLPSHDPQPPLVCEQCGQPDAHAVGDEVLCDACCHERGSCGAIRDTTDAGDQRLDGPKSTQVP